MGKAEIGKFLSALAIDSHVTRRRSLIGISELVRHDPATISWLPRLSRTDSPPPLLPLYNIHSQAVKSAKRFSPTRSFDEAQDRFIPNATWGIVSKLYPSKTLAIKRYTLCI